MNEAKVSVESKYNLTIEEASKYFNIGENKLRSLIKVSGCDFVLYVGKKALIKKSKLEQFLDSTTYL